MRYIGVDLHTTSFTVCWLEEDKNRFETFSLEQGLWRFIELLQKDDEVAVEATGNSRYFYDLIRNKVKRVVIVAPKKFELIRKSVNKTDKNDARALAYFLSKDLLPESRIKEQFYTELSSLAQTRDKFVKLRTTLINKMHGLLNTIGIKVKKETLMTKKGMNKVFEGKYSEIMQIELEVIRDEVESLNQRIGRLSEALVEKGQRIKGHENLVSIKGIGEKSATVLLSVIGDIHDFADENKLASYFGLVPKVRQSNETTHHGRITKVGSKLGRTTLVQCTLIAIRYSDYLREFYERIKLRRGSSGKAIIATAKKLLGIIYKTLKNDWIFEDFPNFVLANK
jgi:transposase